jgi:hypothetical protein
VRRQQLHPVPPIRRSHLDGLVVRGCDQNLETLESVIKPIQVKPRTPADALSLTGIGEGFGGIVVARHNLGARADDAGNDIAQQGRFAGCRVGRSRR